jgi:cytochrome c oxidase subunit II
VISSTETRRFRPVAVAALAMLTPSGCAGGALDPKGDGARTIAGGWWLMFGLGTAVFVLVLAVLGTAFWRGRGRSPGAPEEESPSSLLIIGGGVVLPAVVIAVLVTVTIAMGAGFDDRDDAALRIDVVGHQYWWDVEYPDQGVRTANEIHVPAGRQVELTMTSNDVIHSFWVPQLHGKIDLIPGRTTTLRFEAEEPGTYRGQCAEFCSIGHAFMEILVVAVGEDDFAAWARTQAEPARHLDENEPEFEGQQIFLGSSCVYCHRVDGTNASSRFGPDLTHLASRSTLGAGVLDNTRGNLGGWILDPQHHKPGNRMPATQLEAEELQRLLDYLESLD